MNWATFTAMLARDVRVARRGLVALLLQTMLQPLMFVFVFGLVMTRSGMMQSSYKGLLVPGIMAMTMVITGVWAVAMPLIGEFQFSREIEDRLLAPMRIEYVAVEKLVSGVVQAIISGIVVLIGAWLVLGRGIGLSIAHPAAFVVVALLVALLSAAIGLTVGCSVGQTQIGLMFSLVFAPMIFFGCVYYPWSALHAFPVLRVLVLINPMVYAAEGLRGILAPQYPHMPIVAVIAALAVLDAVLIAAGINRFLSKAIG